MNPIQKQLLGLGVAVMLAMLIFPPWTKITHHVVMGTDRNRSTMQTETQEFAGYSPLFEPPKTRSLDNPQMLVPGDYYETVEIDFALFLVQWLTAAFLTAAGLLYFKGSDKKSLQDWWSSPTTAKSQPTTNPPIPTTPSFPISETQVSNQRSKPRKRPWLALGIGLLILCFLLPSVWMGFWEEWEGVASRETPNSSPSPQVEKPNNAAGDATQAATETNAEAQAAAQFEKDFYEKYPDLKPYGSVCDAVALKVKESGYRGESREAVMETFANAAMQELGRRFEQGDGVAKNYVEAAKWYQKAAEQNYVPAQYNLGVCYAFGDGVTKDQVEAVKWYSKAAEQNYAPAQYNLGVCYAFGDGVTKDQVEAVKWFRKAAEQNYAQAQYNLGLCYDDGRGVAKDTVEAVKWYRKAAEQNDVNAQCNLGYCYANGEGVAKNAAEAVKWYRKAAEQNDADAQFYLGVCYEHGNGVAEDQVEAVKWYRKAAEQNDADAQYNLGVCYGTGQGVANDYAEAVKWFRKAAEQNHATAQFNLGLCYAKGDGVTKDYVEAYKWLDLASSQDVPDAKKNLVLAEGLMTPDQIAEAQRLVREFKPTRASELGVSGSQ